MKCGGLGFHNNRVLAPAGLAQYEAARHFADARAVTKLSAYVHHGQLSARLLAVRASPGTALPVTHFRALGVPSRTARVAGACRAMFSNAHSLRGHSVTGHPVTSASVMAVHL